MLVYNDIASIEERMEVRGFIDSILKDNPSNVRVKHNNFTFNGEQIIQINRTAMGTTMAPSYANIFMGKLKKTNYTIFTPEAIFLVSFHRRH
jgi:hypothetical protein